jgi:predicted type IV restriction endonuclease
MSAPKRTLDRFQQCVPKMQKIVQIAKDRDVNEADTVAVLRDILANVFGYDKCLEITSEFAIRGTYCDLAIKVDGKIQFLVEAKAVGIDLKESHIKQACDYGANQGVQWVVLTNGVTWRVYRIRFEQPINYELICTFDFMSLNCRDEHDQDCLFLLSRDGLSKNAREAYYEKAKCVNRFVIGNLLLSDNLTSAICKEIRKISDGLKVRPEEVLHILENEVIKRDILEDEAGIDASKLIAKALKKETKKIKPEIVVPAATAITSVVNVQPTITAAPK